MPSWRSRIAAQPGPGGALDPVALPGGRPRRRGRLRRLPVRRGHAHPAHGHLVGVLRLVPRDGQGAPRGERRPGRARRHLAGAGLGPRPLPAHAPPGHAAHHRGDLGPPAPSARRRGPAHHGGLAGPGRAGAWCGRGAGGRGRRHPGAGDPDPQRPCRRRHRARHLAAGRAALRRRATRRRSSRPSPTWSPGWRACGRSCSAAGSSRRRTARHSSSSAAVRRRASASARRTASATGPASRRSSRRPSGCWPRRAPSWPTRPSSVGHRPTWCEGVRATEAELQALARAPP